MFGLRSMLTRMALPTRIVYQPIQAFHVSQVDLRARQSTRLRKAKIAKKNKAEKEARIAKIGALGLRARRNKGGTQIDKHLTTDWKRIPTDDAYPGRYYRWTLYKVADAIQAHKDTHHPEMYDAMNSPLNVSIEMNMVGDKPTRMVSNFQKLVMIKHPFNHGQERNILVFAKEEENRSNAERAGAKTVGGVDLVKLALKGNIKLNDYQYILAHPDIMPELLPLRSTMNKRFPSARNDTLSMDIYNLVQKYSSGLMVVGERDKDQENFGLVETCIGTLDMPAEHLIENFNDIMTSVNTLRPKRGGKFITRVLFKSPPSKEIFRIDPVEFPFEDYERPEDEKKVIVQKKSLKKRIELANISFVKKYDLFKTPIQPSY